MAEAVIDGELESDMQKSSSKRQRTSSTAEQAEGEAIDDVVIDESGEQMNSEAEIAQEAAQEADQEAAPEADQEAAQKAAQEAEDAALAQVLQEDLSAELQLDALRDRRKGDTNPNIHKFNELFSKIQTYLNSEIKLNGDNQNKFSQLKTIKRINTIDFNKNIQVLHDVLYHITGIEKSQYIERLDNLHDDFYNYIKEIDKELFKLSRLINPDTLEETSIDYIVRLSGLLPPPILLTSISSDNIISLFRDSSILNITTEAVSPICEIVLGVYTRYGEQVRSSRNEIELTSPSVQAIHIASRFEWDGNIQGLQRSPPSDQAIIAAKTLRPSDNIKCCCYGTKMKVDFSSRAPQVIKNEWEHVCPSLLQSILNGLCTKIRDINITMNDILKIVFPSNHPIHEFTNKLDGLCISAQNRQLLLSIRGFNQAKCSYMLFDIDIKRININGIICNYINIKVNTDIAKKVYYHMMGEKWGSSCRGAKFRFPVLDNISNASNVYINASGSYPSNYGKPTIALGTGKKLSLDEFIDNLKVVADNYNELLNRNHGFNGVLILACANIYTSFIAYNSKSGRETYVKNNSIITQLPIIHRMALLQKKLLDEPAIQQKIKAIYSPASTSGGGIMKDGNNKINKINKINLGYLKNVLELFKTVESNYDLWGENYDMYNEEAEDLDISKKRNFTNIVRYNSMKMDSKIHTDVPGFSTPTRVPISSYGGKKTKKKNYDRSHIPFMIQELNKLNMKYKKKKSKKTKKKKKKKKKLSKKKK